MANKILGELRVRGESIEDLGAGLYQLSIKNRQMSTVFFNGAEPIVPGESEFILTDTTRNVSSKILVDTVKHYTVNTYNKIVSLTIVFSYNNSNVGVQAVHIGPQITNILAHKSVLGVRFAVSPQRSQDYNKVITDSVKNEYGVIEHGGIVYYLHQVKVIETKISYFSATDDSTVTSYIIDACWGMYSSKIPAIQADLLEIESIAANVEGSIKL